MGTNRSGWCLRPYSEWSKDQHDKCPKNFATGGTCSCDCAHPAERSRESLEAGADWAPTTTKSRTRGGGAVDKLVQDVYTERVPTTGGAQALRALHKGASHEEHTEEPKP